MNETPTLVTVSGPPGSGTTTLSERLADERDYELISGGDIFRQMASDRGMTLAEFTEVAEDDDSIDRELDKTLADIMDDHVNEERACDGDGLVVDSRLAGWFSPDQTTLRVWLRCPVEVRADRTEERNETPSELAEREDSDARRYAQYYDIDINETSIYDMVLDTQRLPADTVYTVVSDAIDGVRPIEKTETT